MKAIQINKIQGVPHPPSETVVAQIRLLLQNCEKMNILIVKIFVQRSLRSFNKTFH